MKITGTCLVCSEPASGRNFNARSCAACCAFFRRSIVEDRKYLCRESQKCDVTAQVKRKESSLGFCCIRSSDADGSPNVVESLSQLRLKLQDLKHARLIHYGHQLDEKLKLIPNAATCQNFDLIDAVEPELLWSYLNSHDCFQYLNTADKMALFQNFAQLSRSLETALSTVHYGGLETNTIFLLDASFVSCKQKAFKLIFAEAPHLYPDPDFIARTYLPPMLFIIEHLAPAVQAANLSDMEIAALFNLLLWDPANLELSPEGKLLVDKQRQQLLTNLSQFYELNNIDMPLRFGNLCLLLAPIKEHSHIRQEMNRIIDLSIC